VNLVTSLGPVPVTAFRGEHWFLANPCACPVAFEGILYPSAEHAFQAAKTLDQDTRRGIAALADWRQAKQAGRALVLRPGWNGLRRAVMLQIVLDKFTRSPELRTRLAATGRAVLLEGNSWGDTDWGAVLSGHPAWSAELPWWHTQGAVWAGHNWLGFTLMVVRDVLDPDAA